MQKENTLGIITFTTNSHDNPHEHYVSQHGEKKNNKQLNLNDKFNCLISDVTT
jgi:hypothetical protein